MIKYRSDVDGLRGLSVLAVILFHADIAAFSGGFIGVDVFFVISGFLITSILLGDARAGKFSIIRFYERRIRRIFPALFLMLSIVSIFAVILLLPPDLKDYGQSLATTALSLSNVLFWREAGYFSMDSSLKPLLHTWSLGVEEQFYIFFPLFIWLIYRFRQQEKILFFFGGALLFSLLISIWSTPLYPNFSFFLPLTRAWELMLGGVIALGRLPQIKSISANNVLAAIGLTGVIAPVFVYTDETVFPGINALAPCIGAGLVIYSGIQLQTAIHRFLSLKPIVFAGLISYSLYLWHWPIFSLYRYYSVDALSFTETSSIIVASTVIAFLSWRFIEQPFRGSKPIFSRQQLFAFAILSIAAAVIIGATLHIGKGFPQRIAPEVQSIIAVRADVTVNRDKCLLNDGQSNLPPVEACQFGYNKSGNYDTVLWGDSHADQLVPGLEQNRSKNKFSGRRITKAGCAPLFGTLRAELTGRKRHDCKNLNDNAMDFIINDTNIKTVIMTARWVKYTEGKNRHNNDDFAYLTNEKFNALNKQDSRSVFSESLNDTVEKLVKSGKKVILIGPVPEPGYRVPDCLAKAKSPLFPNLTCKNPLRQDVDADVQFSHEQLRKVKNKFPQIDIFLPVDVLCGRDICPVEIEGEPLYRDKDHLSFKGSEYLIKKLDLR